MRLLCIGDIVGGAGRKAVAALLPALIERHDPEWVVANGENLAGGNGITATTAEEMLARSVDVLTGGNHTWRYKEAVSLLERLPDRVLRPYNFPRTTPGRGYTVCTGRRGGKLGVLSLQGRVFMQPLLNPFEAADEAIAMLRQQTAAILVDFHAEATSEKRALGWYLDGRVSAVVGTHTHVQTADEEVLPQGTAYLTDLGMTGPYDSVIGTQKELVIEQFLSLRPAAFEVAKRDLRLCGALIDIDEDSGRARSIVRVCERLEEAR